MIGTILALPAADDGARMASWRQLVDLVAQAAGSLDPAVRTAAHIRIAELRRLVPARERRRAAAGVAGRTVQPDAVAIFATDEPAIAAPVLTRAILDDAEWLALLPTLPPTSRAILRNRRDLTAVVERALASYGASDFALPTHSDTASDVDPGSQIRNLVARIEAFRSQSPIEPLGTRVDSVPAADFVFETAADGTVDWLEGTSREAVIGLSIADVAPPRGYGVDGQAAGAFRRRAPFREARLAIPGTGSASGDWLISAAPIFNPRDGRFAGYHGSARRPRHDERADGGAARVAGTTLSADSLRQLVHELRTPLNAIQGFAEMIDHQMLGPAASAYRERAQHIAGESRRLLEVVEDLDTAARIDTNSFEADTAATSDAAEVLERIAVDLRPSLTARNVVLETRVDETGPVAISPALLERMVQRLITAALGVAQSSEVITVSLSGTGAHATLSVTRPRVLAGRDERALLDPGFGPDGEWPDAPILGLGFTIRLVGNLARQTKAMFSVTDDALVLTLPLATTEAGRVGGKG